MAIWVSTAALIIILAAIVRSEVRWGRRSKVTQHQVDQQIDDLAKTTFDRHRDVFGRDPTGVFPLHDTKPSKK